MRHKHTHTKKTPHNSHKKLGFNVALQVKIANNTTTQHFEIKNRTTSQNTITEQSLVESNQRVSQ